MSILSNPQGRPERIYSLYWSWVAADPDATEEHVRDFVNPGYTQQGSQLLMDKANFANVPGAAQFLNMKKLVAETRSAPLSYQLLLDQMHNALVALDADDLDAVLLRAFAFFVVKSEQQGNTFWYTDDTLGVVDEISAALNRDSRSAPAMNPTKYTAWRRWMVALGLMVPNPIPSKLEIVDITRRLERTLSSEIFSDASVFSAAEFLSRLSREMPYVDRGTQFNEACAAVSFTPKLRHISRVLSYALQELHSDDMIKLISRGDDPDNYRLQGDTLHERQTFVEVQIVRRQ